MSADRGSYRRHLYIKDFVATFLLEASKMLEKGAKRIRYSSGDKVEVLDWDYCVTVLVFLQTMLRLVTPYMQAVRVEETRGGRVAIPPNTKAVDDMLVTIRVMWDNIKFAVEPSEVRRIQSLPAVRLISIVQTAISKYAEVAVEESVARGLVGGDIAMASQIMLAYHAMRAELAGVTSSGVESLMGMVDANEVKGKAKA